MSRKQNSKNHHRRSNSFTNHKNINQQAQHRIFMQNADKGLNIQLLVKESQNLQHQKINIIDDFQDDTSTNPQIVQIGKQKLIARLRNDFLYPDYQIPVQLNINKVCNCLIKTQNRVSQTRNHITKKFDQINKMLILQDDLSQIKQQNKTSKRSRQSNIRLFY